MNGQTKQNGVKKIRYFFFCAILYRLTEGAIAKISLFSHVTILPVFSCIFPCHSDWFQNLRHNGGDDVSFDETSIALLFELFRFALQTAR